MQKLAGLFAIVAMSLVTPAARAEGDKSLAERIDALRATWTNIKDLMSASYEAQTEGRKLTREYEALAEQWLKSGNELLNGPESPIRRELDLATEIPDVPLMVSDQASLVIARNGKDLVLAIKPAGEHSTATPAKRADIEPYLTAEPLSVEQVRKALTKHLVEAAGTSGSKAFEQALAMQERGEIQAGKAEAFRRILEPIYGHDGIVPRALDAAASAIQGNNVELHHPDGTPLVTRTGLKVRFHSDLSMKYFILSPPPNSLQSRTITPDRLHELAETGLSAMQWVAAAEELLPRVAARAAQYQAASIQSRDMARRRLADVRPRARK